MRLGIHFANFTLPGGPEAIAGTLSATAAAAEEAGVARFSLMDHWFQMEHFATAQDPMLEGYTSLGYLAGKTSTMDLGLLATGITYRHPGLLAKIATTLDVLSGGRALFAVGAAWYEREHKALGVPFPPLKERFERLEETIRIARQMWSDDEGPFHGEHYQLAETICRPRPIQQPGPPVLIAGGGERKTLKLVARYGHACNLFGTGPDDVARKLDVLKQHCDDEGTDYSRIEKTIVVPSREATTDIDAFLSAMEQYADLGIELAEIVPGSDDPAREVASFGGRVVPRLAEMG